MSVARITEISATSDTSFEDAIVEGIARAAETLRNVKSAWVKSRQSKSTTEELRATGSICS